MTYAPNRADYQDYYESHTTRGRRDSDATLIENRFSVFPEPVNQGYRRNRHGYDHNDRRYYDQEPSQRYEEQLPCGCRTHRPVSADDYYESDAPRRSHLERPDLYAENDTGYSQHHDRGRRRGSLLSGQSVRFDDDEYYDHPSTSSNSYSRHTRRAPPTHYADRDYTSSLSHDPRYSNAMEYEPEYERYHDYDNVQGEYEYDNYSPEAAAAASRYDQYDSVRDRLPSPAQPAVAPQPPPGSLPFTLPGFLPYPPPQKEKKVSLSRRLKQAFVAISTNPDDVLLGIKPDGQPSRQHSSGKEAGRDASAREEGARQPQPRGAQQEHSYSTRQADAEAYVYQHNDIYNHTRGSMPAITAPRPLRPHQYDQQQYHYVLPLYHHPPKDDKVPLSGRVKKALAEFVREPPLPSPPPIPSQPPSRRTMKGKGTQDGQRRGASGSIYGGELTNDYAVNQGELS